MPPSLRPPPKPTPDPAPGGHGARESRVVRRTRPRLRPARVALALLALFFTTVAACPSTWAHLRAASLLVRMSGGRPAWVARMFDAPIVEEDLLLQSPWGPFRARVYRPRDGRGPWPDLVLAHGIHFMGIDEPRLIPFARNLARAGVVVMTPELAALADYRVHASSVEELARAVVALDARADVRRGGVSVLGLSFAGGLSLLAAARPDVRPHVARVLVLGGHHDLYRVSRFLATDELETPQGTRRMRAHDYGLVVYFYAHAEQFVAPDQLPVFRDALRHILHVDRPHALRAARWLSPEARALFDRINANDKTALAPLVLSGIPRLRDEMAALSPAGHLGPLQGLPVVLLHGANDDVMPPTEAEATARELGPGGAASLLVTPAIKHVTVEGEPTWRDRLRILHAMAGVFGG